MKTNLTRVRSKDTSLNVSLFETFSHTHERAQEILINPLLVPTSARARFFIVSTNDMITSSWAVKLREHLMGEWPASYYLGHLDTTKYARMAYVYLFDYIRNDTSEHDTVLELWLRNCELATKEIQVLCHSAGVFESKREDPAGSSDSVVLLQKALKVIEETISFLSDKPMCAQETSLGSKRVQLPVRKHKSLLSFRAHVICKALGDIDAAIGYLEEAIKYDPNCSENPVDRPSRLRFGVHVPDWAHPRLVWRRMLFEEAILVENPVEMLDELKAQRGTRIEGIASRVVRWEISM
jgi:tetratricopeptide (TPR) repeat protein